MLRINLWWVIVNHRRRKFVFYHVLHFEKIYLQELLKTEICLKLHMLNSFQPSVAFQMETSHLVCEAKQVTGFYIKRSTNLKWLKNL